MQAESSEVATALIKPNSRLGSFERLEIYNQQYWWRLLGAFAEDFPGVQAVLGPRRFEALSVAYLDEHPSRSWTMRNLGAKLPEFLAEKPELSAPFTALAREVAQVEWATTAAFDDPEKPPIDTIKVSTADPSKLRLGLQPHLQVLELKYPVDRLMGRLRKRSVAPGVASNAMSKRKAPRPLRLRANPLARPLHLAVHRSDGTVYFKRLDPVAYGLLIALREGKTVEAACESVIPQLEAAGGDASALVRSSFSTFTSLGWLTKI
jgi:hypothetical protein